MAKERKITSVLRSDIKLQHKNIKEVLLIDAPKSKKKPYDFHTLFFFNDKPPRFLAWEAKKVDGYTFNFRDILSHQLEAFQEYNKIIDHRYVISYIFCLYMIRFGIICILDPLNLNYILNNNSDFLKFNISDMNNKNNFIKYTSGANINGRLFMIKRYRTKLYGGVNKTIWNTEPFFDFLYG